MEYSTIQRVVLSPNFLASTELRYPVLLVRQYAVEYLCIQARHSFFDVYVKWVSIVV